MEPAGPNSRSTTIADERHRALAFHGSFHIPLSHVTNAYVSDLEDLELQYDLKGTNWGLMKSAGVFGNPQGLIFVDVGEGDCLSTERPKWRRRRRLRREVSLTVAHPTDKRNR